jgi:hypothetical protein
MTLSLEDFLAIGAVLLIVGLVSGYLIGQTGA